MVKRYPLFLILSIILLHSKQVRAQSNVLPKWAIQTFINKKLDTKYQVNAYIKPSFLIADYDGDNLPDIAISIINKFLKKKE